MTAAPVVMLEITAATVGASYTCLKKALYASLDVLEFASARAGKRTCQRVWRVLMTSEAWSPQL